MIKTILLILIASIALLGCVSKEPLPKYVPELTSNFNDKYIPIIRLHHSQDDSFFCSASVINSKYALTAAHCLRGLNGKVINIKLEDKGEILTTAKIAKFDILTDLALIVGDFSKFNTIAVVTDPAEQIQLIDAGNIVSCGYPYGGPLYCTLATPTDILDFDWLAKAQIFPGMSGGPVISRVTFQIIGINYGMSLNRTVISPIVNLFNILNIPVEAK